MKRFLLLGLAACALTLAPALSASAMSIPKQSMVATDSRDVIQVRGHRGGHGHHYGWGRGRGHHYGWARGRHRGWH